jgi:predicted AAA+ superfamily ATPase
MALIKRSIQPIFEKMVTVFPIVTVTGPRQSGKTTLCRTTFPRKPYVSFEALDVRQYARTDPRGFLHEYRNGAIFDEIQREPDLLSYLQIEVDEHPEMGKYILTGSANLLLLSSISQSLAGRTALLTLLPLSLEEIGRFPKVPNELHEVLFLGGYPALFDRHMTARDWFQPYVATYVERDVRQLLNVGDLSTFQRFLGACAGRTTQLLNLSSLGGDVGITHATAQSWISVLEASYIALRLPAYQSNFLSRLVKAPKLHFYDSGLVCHLLGIQTPMQLSTHPLRGAIFESWVISEIIKARANRGLPFRLSHYRDQKGEEVDAILERGNEILAVEAKASKTIAEDFFKGLDSFERKTQRAPSVAVVKNRLVYGGDQFQKRTRAEIVPWNQIQEIDWGDTE